MDCGRKARRAWGKRRRFFTGGRQLHAGSVPRENGGKGVRKLRQQMRCQEPFSPGGKSIGNFIGNDPPRAKFRRPRTITGPGSGETEPKMHVSITRRIVSPTENGFFAHVLEPHESVVGVSSFITPPKKTRQPANKRLTSVLETFHNEEKGGDWRRG